MIVLFLKYNNLEMAYNQTVQFYSRYQYHCLNKNRILFKYFEVFVNGFKFSSFTRYEK